MFGFIITEIKKKVVCYLDIERSIGIAKVDCFHTVIHSFDNIFEVTKQNSKIMKLSNRFEIVIVRNSLEKFWNGAHLRGKKCRMCLLGESREVTRFISNATCFKGWLKSFRSITFCRFSLKRVNLWYVFETTDRLRKRKWERENQVFIYLFFFSLFDTKFIKKSTSNHILLKG